MNFSHQLTPVLIGVSFALVQSQVAVALSREEVSQVAKNITVLIQSQGSKPRYGSGVIIKRQGKTYTVLTAAHVVDVAGKYEIVTMDRQRSLLNYAQKKQVPGVDLALVQFTSDRNYNVAKMGNSDTSKEGSNAYVAGYPESTLAINQSVYTFTTGEITANATKPLRDGYALVYSNNTRNGMSGGPVLNDKGELIGIHGRADIDSKEIKTGFNLGTPINTFLKLSATTGVDVGVSVPKTPNATKPIAADYYIQGADKYRKGDIRGSIGACTEAIRLNPNYLYAYVLRGLARSELSDYEGAIKDYDQALRINSNFISVYSNRGFVRSITGDYKGAIEDANQAIKISPNLLDYYNRGRALLATRDKQAATKDFNKVLQLPANGSHAYNIRGLARKALGDNQGAIQEFNQAIKISPNFVYGYNNRGDARRQLRDYKGAIEDYNQAIKLNPNLTAAYNNRGLARNVLGDKQGAIQDYTQVIQINPNNDLAYHARGSVRYELKDYKGAIEDYNRAIRLNPNLTTAYNNRGSARRVLNDIQGAIEDYNQAVRIAPNYAIAYYNRGLAYKELGNKQKAIEDYNQAIRIAPNYAIPYYNRGLAYKELGDKQRAIADFQKAAALFQKQGKSDLYQKSLELIKTL